MNKQPVLVIGSAHLDIIATPTNDYSPIDKIGTVHIDIGGTACNIAANLRQMGVEVRFLTAMNRSPYSTIVNEHLHNMGVDARPVYVDNLPTAAFVAQLNPDGDMATAISSMPVDLYSFTDAEISDVMAGTACVIADCNLSGANLDTVTRVANGKHIPVYIAAVSEEKSTRVRAITGVVNGIFMNAREAVYLQASTAPDTTDYAVMAQAMNTALIITQGARGALIAHGGQVTTIPADAINLVAENSLGAGDTFMSAMIKALIFDHHDMASAAVSAAAVARQVLERKNCNLGEANAVEQILRDINDSATYDEMTGLLNRASLEKKAAMAFSRFETKRLRNLSVILFDLNWLKTINDTLGHASGDEAIQTIAKGISCSIRQGDFAGRIGGDEFVCILPGANEGQALEVVARVKNYLNDYTQCHSFLVSVSAGVAQAKFKADTLKTMMARADEQLYRDKANKPQFMRHAA